MRRINLPKEKRQITSLSLFDIAEDGKGVGRHEDLVIFVEKGVPGDVVDVELMRKKKNFAEAKITQLIQPSPHRTAPFCEHFGVCGGCKWQHMTYEAQLTYKQNAVFNALTRIGKIDASEMEAILPSQNVQYYRNKLEFTFSNKRWLTSTDESVSDDDLDALGFHVPGRFDKILQIQHCYLQGGLSNDIRNTVFDYVKKEGITFYDLKLHEGELRNLVIRTASTGELMVILVFAHTTQEVIDKTMNFIKESFPQIHSLLYVVNQKRNDTLFDQEVICYAGRDHIFEEMEGLRYKIGSKSFYQTNSEQAYELYKITREFAQLKGNERVYDLYTGAGTIANFIARQVKEVIGIEYVPSAIEDAKINAQLNGITNTKFFAGDMKDVLTADFFKEHGPADVVITDPPRAGMHPDVVQRLLEMEAPHIVYVSCNAATQARDLEMLSAKYQVERIKPVDMFPQTQHVENVVSLILK
jgi:23S rRNA (uracil1939-C5)-methyltransferase